MRLDLDTIATGFALLFSVSSLAAAFIAYRTATRDTAPARFRDMEREGRELIGELAETLEKTNTMVLRLAKRQSRDAKKALSEDAPADQDIPLVEGPGLEQVPALANDRYAWKAAKLRSMGRL